MQKIEKNIKNESLSKNMDNSKKNHILFFIINYNLNKNFFNVRNTFVLCS